MSSSGPRIAVVGGGITGLAAALRLRDRAPLASITVYEQTNALGGKLRTAALTGVDGTPARVETGAEMFLVAGPSGDPTGDPGGGPSAAVALAHRLGLADTLVHPVSNPAAVVVHGSLRPMPAGTLMGVPADLSTLDGVAQPAADRDHDDGQPLLPSGGDVAVGELVRRRLGDEVADRLVDPLLSGVYAGRADLLSLAATIPALARACREESTLVGAVRAALRASQRPPGPVFATVEGGLSMLVGAVVAELRGGERPVEFRFGLPVRELARSGAGWRLAQGRAFAAQWSVADAVILALPAHRAVRLMRDTVDEAATQLGTVDYASVALVTLALPAVELPPLSGFLVPATEGLTVKAVTFFTAKWAHHRRPDGTVLVRASLGRYGEEHVLRATDAELVTTVRADLAAVLGPLPAPVAAAVTRWGGALPQYLPGHVDRVAAARAALRADAPTLALAGAGYDGVGIPACVRSGTAAADEIVAALREWTP